MHSNAIHLLKKQHSSSFSNMHLLLCLGDTSMDETTRKAIEKKFDIAYMSVWGMQNSKYRIKCQFSHRRTTVLLSHCRRSLPVVLLYF